MLHTKYKEKEREMSRNAPGRYTRKLYFHVTLVILALLVFLISVRASWAEYPHE